MNASGPPPLALAQDPFSGGEIHRLGLLRAWLRDKPLEVLDEPTAFLDAKGAEEVRSVITVKPTPASPPATAAAQTS